MAVDVESEGPLAWNERPALKVQSPSLFEALETGNRKTSCFDHTIISSELPFGAWTVPFRWGFGIETAVRIPIRQQDMKVDFGWACDCTSG